MGYIHFQDYGSTILSIFKERKAARLRLCSKKPGHCGFTRANGVIVIRLVEIDDLELKILCFLEMIFQSEGLREVWVQIFLDHFGLADLCVVTIW